MSLRRIAWEALLNVTERGAYANLALKQAALGLDSKDARKVSALVYTTLDHLMYIDYMLSHFAKGRVQPAVRNVLRLGACELLFMSTPAHAACNESVALAKEIGKGALTGYVNGVLRALARQMHALPALPDDPVKRLSVEYSWPQWLVEEWLAAYGEETTRAVLTAAPIPMSLRAQPPFLRADVEKALEERGIPFHFGEMEPACCYLERGLDVTALPLFQNGGAAVQSESAMLVCRAMALRDGMRVLDACAAPGGKTAYMAALADCAITAWELHEHRVELMCATLERLHVQANIKRQDAAVYLPQYREAFDAVLVDAPCSGLGVTGKPDVRYTKAPDAMQDLERMQARILATCAQYVVPGGTLVYATCTMRPQENERQIQAFLQAEPHFSLDDLRPCWPGKQPPGLETGMVQLFPHRDGTEGFFIARMRRCS